MYGMSKDYYAILEIGRDASATDVKKAYYRLSKIWHPDKNPANQGQAKKRFQDISEAYQVLISEKARGQYDQSRSYGGEFNFEMSSDYFKSSDELFREMFGDKTLDEAIDDFLNDPIFDDLERRNVRAPSQNTFTEDPPRRQPADYEYSSGLHQRTMNTKSSDPRCFKNCLLDSMMLLVTCLVASAKLGIVACLRVILTYGPKKFVNCCSRYCPQYMGYLKIPGERPYTADDNPDLHYASNYA